MEITEQIASPDKNRDRNEAKKHTRDLFKNVFSVIVVSSLREII
jgi:hypothetical protein